MLPGRNSGCRIGFRQDSNRNRESPKSALRLAEGRPESPIGSQPKASRAEAQWTLYTRQNKANLIPLGTKCTTRPAAGPGELPGPAGNRVARPGPHSTMFRKIRPPSKTQQIAIRGLGTRGGHQGQTPCSKIRRITCRGVTGPTTCSKIRRITKDGLGPQAPDTANQALTSYGKSR